MTKKIEMTMPINPKSLGESRRVSTTVLTIRSKFMAIVVPTSTAESLVSRRHERFSGNVRPVDDSGVLPKAEYSMAFNDLVGTRTGAPLLGQRDVSLPHTGAIVAV